MQEHIKGENVKSLVIPLYRLTSSQIGCAALSIFALMNALSFLLTTRSALREFLADSLWLCHTVVKAKKEGI